MRTVLYFVAIALVCAACASPMDVDTDRRGVDVTPGGPGSKLLPATLVEVMLTNSWAGDSNHSIKVTLPQPANIAIDTTGSPVVLNLVLNLDAAEKPVKPVTYLSHIFLRANGLPNGMAPITLVGDPTADNGVKTLWQTPMQPPGSGYDKVEVTTVNGGLTVQILSCEHVQDKRQFLVQLTLKVASANILDGPIAYTGSVVVYY